MISKELTNDTFSTSTFDDTLYSKSDYPDEYVPAPKSSAKYSTQGLSSVSISKEHMPQMVVLRSSREAIARRERVREMNREINRKSLAY